MFERLGQFVSRQWLPLLVGWILALVVLWVIAPPLKTVIEDGDFKFLPKDLPSVQAEKLFKNAFENDLLKSSIVIVAHRDSSEGLTEEDKAYIDEKLVPRLAKVVGLPESGKPADTGNEADAAKTAKTDLKKKPADAAGNARVDAKSAVTPAEPKPVDSSAWDSIVADIRTFSDKDV